MPMNMEAKKIGEGERSWLEFEPYSQQVLRTAMYFHWSSPGAYYN